MISAFLTVATVSPSRSISIVSRTWSFFSWILKSSSPDGVFEDERLAHPQRLAVDLERALARRRSRSRSRLRSRTASRASCSACPRARGYAVDPCSTSLGHFAPFAQERKRGTTVPTCVLVPHSLALATHLDVLPLDAGDRAPRRLHRRALTDQPDALLRQPPHLRQPARAGDGERCEGLFAEELGADPRIRHRTFAWDRTDGDQGAADDELAARGYLLDDHVAARRAARQAPAAPAREHATSRSTLDPADDAELWDAVIDLQLATARSVRGGGHRLFLERRLEGLRDHFRAGRGAWYAALTPATGEVVASCGVVVTGGRGRYQLVDTAPRTAAAASPRASWSRPPRGGPGAEQLVIVADAHYHALGLYESLGFERRERALAAFRPAAGRNRLRPELRFGRETATEGDQRWRIELDPLRWKALAVVCAAFFMTVLDVSIVNVALPSIGKALHFSRDEPAVGDHRLRDHLRRLPAARRARGRPARAPPRVPRRRRRLHGRVVLLRPRLVRGRADRRPRASRASAPRSSRRPRSRSSRPRSRRARSGTRRSASGARSAARAPRSACSPAAS